MSIGNRLVSVINLGCIGYKEAWAVQQILARRHIPQSTRQDKNLKHDKEIETEIDRIIKLASKDTLLLCEHNPVYTIGIRTADYPLEEEDRLKKLGAEFYRTDCGGLITFHGPGQLVAYPILNLGNFKKSIRWYVCQLETCIIKLCREFGIEGEKSPHTGVWVKDNKIAAIGIHSKRYITSHGLALNCNTDMNWFNHIVPCGIVGKGVTSLTKELDYEVAIEDAIPVFLKCFSEQFGCKLEWANWMWNHHDEF